MVRTYQKTEDWFSGAYARNEQHTGGRGEAARPASFQADVAGWLGLAALPLAGHPAWNLGAHMDGDTGLLGVTLGLFFVLSLIAAGGTLLCWLVGRMAARYCGEMPRV